MKSLQGFNDTEDGYGPVEDLGEEDPCEGCTCPECDSCSKYHGSVDWDRN